MTLLAGAAPDAVERATTAVAEAFQTHVTDAGVKLGAAIWLFTATRR